MENTAKDGSMAPIEKQTDSFGSGDGTRIFYRRHVPANVRLQVVVSHGLGEHSGRYGHLTEILAPLGVSFWILDHRGHGRSQGRRGHVNHFNDYVGDLQQLVNMAAADGGNKVPTFLLGHSMGGLIALSLARQHPEEIDGLIVSSPLLGVIAPLPALQYGMVRLLATVWPTFSLDNQLDPTLISHDADQVAAYRQDQLVHNKISARWIVACMTEIEQTGGQAQRIRTPILMQIAGDDRLVAPQQSLAFYEALRVSDRTLCHYPTMYHEIYNERLPDRATVLDDLKRWIVERLL